jgi:predicted nicotinamide N-methyase
VFSIERFYAQYKSESTEIIVADRKFRILIPENLDDFINPSDVLHNFPLWAKLWKASWILADFMAQMPADTDKQILEIGGGLGLVSIVACTFGHLMTMTEYNQDALQFAQANAHLNNCAHLPVVQLDWSRPNLAGEFDLIVASEVVYRKNDFAPLLQLFQTYLKPTGEIVLAAEMRESSKEFYKFLLPFYDVKTAKRVLRSKNEKNLITLFKLRPKK